MTEYEEDDTDIPFRLSKDLRKAALTLSGFEVRYMVDFYYQKQKDRIRTNNRIKAASKDEEPHAVLKWFLDSDLRIEKSLRSALEIYAKSKDLGRWSMSIHGVGPVITAGLLANIDIEKAPTVGHIWRFAGLDPTVTWGKKEKRPWNASLKRLCWIIGGCFVRMRASEKDIYGKVYDQRKAYEQEKNERGDYAELAAKTLKDKKITEAKTKAAYEAGRLPDGRIDLRCRRYAVKLFLSHYHHVAYELHHGTAPPKPYIIEHGGHIHFIRPPHWEDGMVK